MGNSFSTIVKNQKQEEINCVIADVMNCFLLRFLVHYKHRIISKYAGYSPSMPDLIPPQRQLLSCPPVDVPLMKGIIGKQRDWLKSWADRYVVVCNEAQNYRIDYYRNSQQIPPPASALRGSIFPVGYYIESFLSDSEMQALRLHHCIKLSPLNPKKRPWYLKVLSPTNCICNYICNMYL